MDIVQDLEFDMLFFDIISSINNFFLDYFQQTHNFLPAPDEKSECAQGARLLFEPPRRPLHLSVDDPRNARLAVPSGT